MEVIRTPPVLCTNGDLLVEIACQGRGILIRSEWGVEREVKSGQLVRINLDDELVSESNVYVVYPKNRHSPFRVKAFIETLTKGFE